MAGSPWAGDGRRVGAGRRSILPCAALASSIQVLLDHGGALAIQAHVVELQKALLAKLAGSAAWISEADRLGGLVHAGKVGSILAFVLSADHCERVWNAAEAGGIGTSIREGYLRIAFHGWHSSQDVEQCAQWLLTA